MWTFLKQLLKRKPKVPRVDLKRRYELITTIGQGSMSQVWRARDPKTGNTYAIKILDKKKTKQLDDRFAMRGLIRPTEGEVAIQLEHPHIVHTYEYGWSVDNEMFLVMDFVEGVGLSFLVDTQNETLRSNRLRLIIELGQAIEYFHSRNFIHRDICPRNVLLDEDHRIKLIDFGLVVPNTPEFQQPGNRTGTMAYMAPELLKRQQTDQRIDIFSYAMSCYEMYSRRLPWSTSDETAGMERSMEMMHQRINQPATDIREFVSDIDEDVAETIMRGLESSPSSRWASASQMVARFRDIQQRLGDSG